MDVAYVWMGVHACSIYITRDACIHDWMHGTDMIRIKEVDWISRPPDFALDKDMYTHYAYEHESIRNLLRTMNACDWMVE